MVYQVRPSDSRCEGCEGSAQCSVTVIDDDLGQ